MKNTKDKDIIIKDIERIADEMSELKNISLNKLNSSKTIHIAVDMVNGFVKEGALSSSEVLSINKDVADFSARCKEYGIRNYALCDCHPESCTEFLTYPVHCVKGTAESELTDELKNHEVILSYSSKFYSDDMEMISGAEVFLVESRQYQGHGDTIFLYESTLIL